MTVIDVHAHIYPEKIADRAVDSVRDFYDVPMAGDGTAAGLLKTMEQAPITNFVIHSVAVSASRVESINNFIAEQCRIHPEFIGFAAMHHDFVDKEAEIERAIKLGLKGVKIHPDTQEVNMDDPRLMELFEIIEGRLPIVIHTGDFRYDYSHPRRLKAILKAFPNLVVNAAHFGGWSISEIAYDNLKDANCFMDMSSSMSFLAERCTKELVNMYGTDRIMFGSDFPMVDPASEYHRFASLNFSDSDHEKLFHKNAERFLGFSV